MKLARAVAALLFLLAGAAAFGRTPVDRHGQLRVEGARIVGEDGRPAVLRGVSLFWSQWHPEYYNPSAVRWLRDDWNAAVVRAAVAVHSGGYLEHPAREWRKLERVVEAAVDLGMYVIVDWHAHEPEPEAAAAFFERVARRWGHLPNIIYEPYNEPLREHGWAEVVKPYHLAVVGRIRAIDPDNLVVAGTRSWSQDVDEAAADPLPFANTAYTLHFYAGTHGGELRAKAEAAMARGAALFVTEWGTSEASGDGRLDLAETRAWWDFMARHGLSDLNWSIADKAETSAALRPGARAGGRWPLSALSPSGRLVRDRLRRLNPPMRPPEPQPAR